MTIIIPRNNLLQHLFPEISDINDITDEDLDLIKEVYAFKNVQPEIKVEENAIKVVFDEKVTDPQSQKLEKVIELCETREYDEALPKIEQLIEEDPAVSEYYRIKGQALSEQGHPQKALDSLIEAVRLDPDNSSALIMLGNIYAKNRSDADTALTFYKRVLETNPENHLAINNIGGNLADLGKYDDAKRYFELAHELNPDYPNTLYGMGLLESKRENPEEAFDYSRRAFFNLNPQQQPNLYKKNLNLIKDESRKYMRGGGI